MLSNLHIAEVTKKSFVSVGAFEGFIDVQMNFSKVSEVDINTIIKDHQSIESKSISMSVNRAATQWQ